jgi:5-methyltetrahydrofolate--homocysteine methyltransferase
MDDQGIPQSKDQALDVGVNLIDNLLGDGVPVEEIYVDPLVRSVATNQDTIVETLALMNEIGAKFPGLHFISGLSNVSFGLPERRHINRAFVVLSIANGLDAVIIDPLDATMLALIYATEALVNRDRFCRKYIEAYRKGKLKV